MWLATTIVSKLCEAGWFGKDYFDWLGELSETVRYTMEFMGFYLYTSKSFESTSPCGAAILYSAFREVASRVYLFSDFKNSKVILTRLKN